MVISKAIFKSIVRVPPRAQFAHHRGVTLVELMIAMLILAIVCVAWLEIIGVQSAKREARRREAVERLAGMMDAFMYENRTSVTENSYYLKSFNPLAFRSTSNTSEPIPDLLTEPVIGPTLEPRLSPIGHRLLVVKNLTSLQGDDANLLKGKESLFYKAGAQNVINWCSKKWLIGILYDRTGATKNDAGEPFFVLPVCLGL